MSYVETIAELDAVNRTRALLPDEVDRLARAIMYESRSSGLPPPRSWRPDEDETARRLRNDGLSYGKIADHVHRSPDAIAARLRCLRLKSLAGGSPL